jgi:hypothetical protein
MVSPQLLTLDTLQSVPQVVLLGSGTQHSPHSTLCPQLLVWVPQRPLHVASSESGVQQMLSLFDVDWAVGSLTQSPEQHWLCFLQLFPSRLQASALAVAWPSAPPTPAAAAANAVRTNARRLDAVARDRVSASKRVLSM